MNKRRPAAVAANSATVPKKQQRMEQHKFHYHKAQSSSGALLTMNNSSSLEQRQQQQSLLLVREAAECVASAVDDAAGDVVVEEWRGGSGGTRVGGVGMARGVRGIARCQPMFDASQSSDKIQIFNLGSSNFAVYTDVDLLFQNFRFLCHSVHRHKSNETQLPNIPVVLLPEQTQVLLENGFAKLSNAHKIEEAGQSDAGADFQHFSCSQFPKSVAYAVKLTVFRDLWRKGFYLADGAKFGCDYLAYRRPPPEQHSEFMVLCMDANATNGAPPLRPLSLIGVSRASTQVRKRILLAIVNVGSPVPYYLEMNWWKGDDE